MDQNSRQTSVMIGDFAVAFGVRGAIRTVNFCRREMLYAICRNEYKLLPIAIAKQKTGFRQELEDGGKQFSQMLWRESVERDSHLVITRNVTFDAINGFQITLFGNGLLFEVQKRRRFQREHSESRLQNFCQRVTRIAGTMLWKLPK